jgi:competence protein ComEC
MTKTLQQAIFLRLSLFYTIGIAIQIQWNLSFYWVCIAIFSFVILIIAFVHPVKSSYRWRWLFGFGLLLLCVSTAGILTGKKQEISEWQQGDSIRSYRVQIIDEPVRKNKTLLFKVEVNNQKALVYLPIDSVSLSLQPADSVLIKAKFEKLEQMHYRKQEIAARSFVYQGNWEKIENASPPKRSIYFSALKCRRNLLIHLRELIPDEKSLSVAAAIILGYTHEMDADVRLTFSETGSAHILSVSGLHFSIIYGIFFFIFSFMGKSKGATIIRQVIVLSFMWMFVFLTGMAPCVIRAAVMLSVWGIGQTFVKRAFTINTWGIAAFFMLLYNPLNLFDIGFQLSFSAVLAILLINPYLDKLYKPSNPLVRYVWGLLCVSTSAQLGTAPLSIYYFHQFPLIFLVTNLFAIPIVGVLMGLIPFCLLLQILFGNHPLLLVPSGKMLHFLISGLESLRKIPNGLINNIILTEQNLICLTLLIIFSALLFVKKRIVYFYLLIIIVIMQVIYYLCPL